MRWRLIIPPMIVLAVAWFVANFNKAPDLVRPNSDSNTKPPEISEDAKEDLEKLLKRDPIQFFSMSLKKYDELIKGYIVSMTKHERINGTLRKPEKCEAWFCEKPFSVLMVWDRTGDQPAFDFGKLTKPAKVLFVDGENGGKLIARPNVPLVPLQTRDVDGPDAKNSGRFTIAQFGFKKSTERTLASMERAQKNGKLTLKYEGIVPVEQLGGQKCHKFVRTPYEPTEEDELNELTLYYDTEYWLQVGAILKDVKGQLLGEYFFTNVQINPTFNEKQFTRDAL